MPPSEAVTEQPRRRDINAYHRWKTKAQVRGADGLPHRSARVKPLSLRSPVPASQEVEVATGPAGHFQRPPS